MDKVLYYSPSPDDNTAFYRSHGVLPYLSSIYYELIDISYVKHFTWATFMGAKVLIIQRPTESIFENMISLAKSMGLKIILDYDDDILNVDIFNPSYGYHSKKTDQVKRIIQSADELWVTTTSLKHSLNHPNTQIIPNALNNYIFIKPQLFNEQTKICVWRGSMTHEADVYEVADKLVNLINRNKDWKFYFIGHQFTFLEQRCSNNYYRVDGMPTIDYFNFINELNPNILICPLCDTPINRSKSNISFIEGSYAGAAFFGNKKLDEFSLICQYDLNTIESMLSETQSLAIAQQLSMDYINDNLLLSDINKIRNERIIANL